MPKLRAPCAGVLLVWLVAVAAVGAVRSVGPLADNTMFSETPSGQHLSNGAGPHIYVGTIRVGPMRRGLLRFDLGAIPAGSTVESAELVLNASAAGLAGFTEVAVHRATASWGEGTSDSGSPGGVGVPATPTDATWVHRFFDTDTWASAGGDFESDATTAVTPGAVGSISFGGVGGDVQAWLDGVTPNHGWLLKLTNEGTTQTAVRFDSRENFDIPARPRLVVTFRGPGDTNGDDLVDIGDFAVLAANFNQPLQGPNFGDFNRDGIVDIGDFSLLSANFNRNFGNPRTTVPEPAALGGLVLCATIFRRR